MKINDYGQTILNEQDIFDGLYSGKINFSTKLILENSPEINQFLDTCKRNRERVGDHEVFQPTDISLEEFDQKNQEQWFMPVEYQNYDIVDWLYGECRTLEQKTRVTDELRLFAQHNMITLLKYLKYLVDTMRANNIVWGVGRGSSVSSYCLYLIGIHKIDSIKYELDIHEFLKEK